MLEQDLRDGKGQGSLACCSPKGHKESDTTEQLNSNRCHTKHACTLDLGATGSYAGPGPVITPHTTTPHTLVPPQ